MPVYIYRNEDYRLTQKNGFKVIRSTDLTSHDDGIAIKYKFFKNVAVLLLTVLWKTWVNNSRLISWRQKKAL